MIELNDEQLEFLSMCYNIENNMPLLEKIFDFECSIEEAESDSDITYYQNQISKIENKIASSDFKVTNKFLSDKKNLEKCKGILSDFARGNLEYSFIERTPHFYNSSYTLHNVEVERKNKKLIHGEARKLLDVLNSY